MDPVLSIVCVVWLTLLTCYLVAEKVRPAPPPKSALSEELKQTIRESLRVTASTKEGRTLLRARLAQRGHPVPPEPDGSPASEGHP